LRPDQVSFQIDDWWKCGLDLSFSWRAKKEDSGQRWLHMDGIFLVEFSRLQLLLVWSPILMVCWMKLHSSTLASQLLMSISCTMGTDPWADL